MESVDAGTKPIRWDVPTVDAANESPRGRGLLWVSVWAAILIANLTPKHIKAGSQAVLARLPVGAYSGNDLDAAAETITNVILLPGKEILFLICVSVMVQPVAARLLSGKDFWKNLELRRITIFAALLFAGMAVLAFPYAYPQGLNADNSGLSGLGPDFGAMSAAPFHETSPLYYKRILKPALAHFLHVHGPVTYYAFSLLLTFILILLIVTYFEARASSPTDQSRLFHKPWIRWLCYLSLMTSSFVMVDFQWPGYNDHLSFILMLLMVMVPTDKKARLAIVGLCVLNHEGIALALIPFILFAFPREWFRLCLPIAVFYIVMVTSYDLVSLDLFKAQGAVPESRSVGQAILVQPGVFTAGLFFTYKLFWIIFGLALWVSRRSMDWQRMARLAGVVVGPVALTLVAWDTTRVAGFGWIGVVIGLAALFEETPALANGYQKAVAGLAAVNLAIPSYNVVLYYSDTLTYPYPGLYRLIDSLIRAVL